MKKVNPKKLLNTIFLIAVFALTMWSAFRGENFRQVLSYIADANPAYIIPGIACVILFIIGESTVIYYLMRCLSVQVQFGHCCVYSFIGFFYSCITPSASGGQPMQIMAMRKDNIPVAVSTVVLAIVTITYKAVLVCFGGVIMLARPEKLMAHLEPVENIIYLGMGLNVLCIGILLLLVFCPNFVRSITGCLLNLVNRIRPMKHPEKAVTRLERILSQYEGTAEFFGNNLHVVYHVFLITFVQRCVLFLITWFTYMAFDLSGYGITMITSLQAMISVAVDMLPLPGGMGASENLFLEIFQPVFGDDLILPGMVISRGISYYTQLLISGIMTLAAPFILSKRKKRADIPTSMECRRQPLRVAPTFQKKGGNSHDQTYRFL